MDLNNSLIQFIKSAKEFSNSLTVVNEHKIGKTVIVPASVIISKEDAIAAMQHIINAYQLTEVDSMGLEWQETKSLTSWIERY